MQLYDSVLRKKVPFEAQHAPDVSMYVCGPTVYDDAHLGHARSALTFDLLYRVLSANGYHVTYARNITDIDDKIIKKAQQEQRNIAEIATRYSARFHEDMQALNILTPTLEPKATENIAAMINLIATLLEENFAYQLESGDIYFESSKDENYLRLSGRIQDESDRQARIESVEGKHSAADFVLWKHESNLQQPGYDAPFGRGRPGWHSECAAMINTLLDQHNTPYAIDIHGGGADLLFPHHENEAAQFRCATHHELAKYWVHNGFITINNEKMSKSLGNSFFLRDALLQYHPDVLRYYLLSSSYRSDFNFSEADLIASKKQLDKLYRLKKRLYGMKSVTKQTPFQEALLQTLNDDLNTSKAYALIVERLAQANDSLDAEPKNKANKQEILADISAIGTLLGFGQSDAYGYFQFGITETEKREIEALIDARQAAKKSKDFEQADAIRAKLHARQIEVMDTPQGCVWEKSEKL